MALSVAPSTSLFQTSNKTASGQRQKLVRAVERFEGVLWTQLAEQMAAVKLGPTGLGYAGSVYQDMLWQDIASRDFGSVDHELTQSTLAQLGARGAQDSTATDKYLGSSEVGDANASVTAAVSEATQPANTSAGQWVKRIWSDIKQGAAELSVPPEALLAQAALETGWGSHAQGHNLFGIKAHDGTPSFTAPSTEEIDGTPTPTESAFTSYPSPAASVADLVSVIRAWHPQAQDQATVASFAHALQDSGYATDPDYAAKLVAVADSARMGDALKTVQE